MTNQKSDDGAAEMAGKPAEELLLAKAGNGSGAIGPDAAAGGPRQARPVHLVALVLALVASFVVAARHVWAGQLPAQPMQHCGGGRFGRFGGWLQAPPLTIEQRVDKILASTPLIDGHDDFPLLIRYLFNNHIYGKDFRSAFETDGLPSHVDLPRLRAGRNGGAFWSLYMPCPANGSDFSDENYYEIVQSTYQQIDLMTRLRALYPNDFSGNVNGTTALAAFQSGKLVSPLAIEGLHQIGNSVANLRRYYAMGVRYATLNHNCGNLYADPALLEAPIRKAPPLWGGLTPLGRKVVLEMNRIGMLVDLSHTSVDTMVDVLVGGKGKAAEAEADAAAGADGGFDFDRADAADATLASWTGSVAPVIFSHSSAYSICPHPRNVPDHVLRLVKARRGLVMVNFAPEFVSCHWTEESEKSGRGIPAFFPPNSTLEHVATHILHIGHLIGFEHVGLGSDYDGIAETPVGLESVADFPALVAELLRRGVSDHDAALVVGGNLLRVWREVDDIALRLQARGFPILEDDLPSFHEGGHQH